MGSSFSRLPIHEADLLTVRALIDSSDERNEIARTSGAAAVDMETEFIARACAEHGIPLLSLRVITDTPREPFPAPPNVLFDIEQQRTRFLTLASILSCTSESLATSRSVRETDCKCTKDSRQRAGRADQRIVGQAHRLPFGNRSGCPTNLPGQRDASAAPIRLQFFAGSMCTSTSATRGSLCWIALFTRCAISWPSCTEHVAIHSDVKIDVKIEAHFSSATFLNLDQLPELIWRPRELI